MKPYVLARPHYSSLHTNYPLFLVWYRISNYSLFHSLNILFLAWLIYETSNHCIDLDWFPKKQFSIITKFWLQSKDDIWRDYFMWETWSFLAEMHFTIVLTNKYYFMGNLSLPGLIASFWCSQLRESGRVISFAKQRNYLSLTWFISLSTARERHLGTYTFVQHPIASLYFNGPNRLFLTWLI